MSEPMTADRLAEIRERIDNATLGPWGVGNSTTIGLEVEQLSAGRFRCKATIAEVTDELDREDFAAENGVDIAHADDDAAFIAHSRQDVEDLLAEVDRLRTPPSPGELRGLDSMCAALHAATETDPVVKEVAWRTFALIRAHREQGAELDRLKGGAKDLGRVIDTVAFEIRRAVRLTRAGDSAAAMESIADWASEAGWLDNLDSETGEAGDR